MIQPINELIERKQFLTNLISQKEEALKNAPRGSLRISRGKKRVQYYRRIDPKDKNGIYLKKTETDTIFKLAQKHYDKLVLKSARKELKALEQYTTLFPAIPPEEIIESIGAEWEKLIHPIRETNAAYISNWLSADYEKKPIKDRREGFLTDRGEIVRSKSELIIANYLYKRGIPYRYEYPLNLRGLGSIHPDFIILNVRLRKEIIWEHFGMMDNERYAADAVNRFKWYQMNGYYPGDNFIFTMETKDNPISTSIVIKMVNKYCI